MAMKRMTFDPNVGLGGTNPNAGGAGAHEFGPSGGSVGGSKTGLGATTGKRAPGIYYDNAKRPKTQAVVGTGTPESVQSDALFGAAAKK